MLNPLNLAKAWVRKAIDALRAYEEALDYRYEGYAQEHFHRLEQRLAVLEKKAATATNSASAPFAC